MECLISLGKATAHVVYPTVLAVYDSARIVAERGRGLDWEFEIGWQVEPSTKDDSDRLYRLEIIP